MRSWYRASIRMRVHGIRDKTFPSPVPQPNEKSIFRFLLFLRPLHSHRSGFIPYSVKVASDRKFFCDSVLKLPQISSTNNNQRMCRDGAQGLGRREALPACLYHICRIRARQGCAAPKGPVVKEHNLFLSSFPSAKNLLFPDRRFKSIGQSIL